MEQGIRWGPAEVASEERTLLVRLPEAKPDTYLSWMAFWREVEAKMLDRPALDQLGSEEAAPFLHGRIALLLSDLVRELSNQSVLAIEARAGWVTPEVKVPPSAEVLAEMASYLWRRGAWLAVYASSIGISPVSKEVEDLRQRHRGSAVRIQRMARAQISDES
jgi:hypothetical protein